LPSHSAQGPKKSDSHSLKASLKFEWIDILLSFIFGMCLGVLIIILLNQKQPENKNTTTGVPPAGSNSPSAPDDAIGDTNRSDSKVNSPMSDQGSKEPISKPYSKN
jgi:hypothetical protein